MVLIKPDTASGRDPQLHLNVKVSSFGQLLLRIKRGFWRFRFTVLRRILKSIWTWLNIYVLGVQIWIVGRWYLRGIKAKAVFSDLFYGLKIFNFGILAYKRAWLLELLVLAFNLLFVFLALRISEKYLYGLFPFLLFALFMLNMVWLKILIVKDSLL